MSNIFSQFPDRFVSRAGKIPTVAGCPIDPHLVSSWKPYEVVASGEFGFVVSAADSIAVLDVDHAKDENGEWNAVATTLWNQLKDRGVYCEISSSGTGMHFFFTVLPGMLQDRKNKFVFNGTNCEFYTDKRFIAITGMSACGNPNVDATEIIAAIVPQRDSVDAVLPNGPRPEWTLGHLTDEQIIAKAISSTGSVSAAFGGKARFADLWEAKPGNLHQFFPTSTPGEPYDRSSADMALMSHLAFWVGCDHVAMDRLFRRSALYREKYEQRADYRNNTITNAIQNCRVVYDRATPARELTQGRQTTVPGIAWDLSAVRTSNGQIPPVLSNAVHYIRSHADLSDRFLFDEMESVVNVRWKVSDTAYQIKPLTEHDVLQTTDFIQSNSGDHLVKIAKETVADAITMVARQHAYHPVRDYLNGVQWDGVTRVSEWLSQYYGADRTHYTSGVGRMWLISAVARIMDPGCKVDTVLVLEGDQGVFKSTGPRILAGDRHFSDGLPDISHGDKDLSVHLAGKWIVEIPEMASTRKADSEALKAFLTRREERYRRPYGRLEVIEPRQCVFIITTNKDSYLRDETGARRFWPVKAVTLNVEALKRDRDQLWAEAVHLYRGGAPWWPDASFEKLAKVQTDERFEIDPWTESVVKFLGSSTETTVGSILELGLNIPQTGMSTVQRNRVLAILRANGWVKGKRTGQNQPYVRLLQTV